jgi:hypothetical protein
MSFDNVEIYAQRNTLKIEKQIGFGIHGKVFALLNRKLQYFTVAKVFEEESPYERERDVYFRLTELDVTEIGRFSVPILVDYDDELLILHMTTVERPFCLDFASAYLDELPAYFPPFGPEWHEEKENQFGSEYWPEVLAVVRELESLGIYQTDVSPSNIAL